MGHRPGGPRPPRDPADRHQGDDGLTEGRTWARGGASVISRWQRRRDPLGLAPGESLSLDADLGRLAATPLPAEPPPPPEGSSRHATKRHELMQELPGQSELALLNALCIAHLRKRRHPRGTAQLFHRIWTEQGARLVTELPMRWLISTIITFGDHGQTEDERRLGLRMGVLFSLMKLYETERRFSGLGPEDAFALNRRSARPLPMGLPDFALQNGALESEFLGPIWADALTTPVAGPVAAEMLDRMDRDPGTIFRRLATMRGRQRDNRAAKAPKTPPAAPET